MYRGSIDSGRTPEGFANIRYLRSFSFSEKKVLPSGSFQGSSVKSHGAVVLTQTWIGRACCWQMWPMPPIETCRHPGTATFQSVVTRDHGFCQRPTHVVEPPLLSSMFTHITDQWVRFLVVQKYIFPQMCFW